MPLYSGTVPYVYKGPFKWVVSEYFSMIHSFEFYWPWTVLISKSIYVSSHQKKQSTQKPHVVPMCIRFMHIDLKIIIDFSHSAFLKYWWPQLLSTTASCLYSYGKESLESLHISFLSIAPLRNWSSCSEYSLIYKYNNILLFLSFCSLLN